MGLDKNWALSTPAYLAAVTFPFVQRLFSEKVYVAAIAFMAACAYLIYVFALIVWSHGKLTYKDAASSFLTATYIILAMNMLVYIRDFGDIGKYIYLLVFLGAWVTDTFAYFVGVFFGKHKLIEDVSPKKTIEGSIGGIVFCILGFLGFGLVVDKFFGCAPNYIFLAVSGAIISVISQIGDLIMSVIKRHYGVKDFGKIFPGHGGMLDRLDSILAVSLAFSLMCMFSYITGIHLI